MEKHSNIFKGGLIKIPKIILEGNIGSGKSTLTKALSKDLRATPILEGVLEDGDVIGNPWLSQYYQDTSESNVSIAFATQIWFIWNRFKSYKNMKDNILYIGDRSLWGDLAFAMTQRSMGKMNQIEFDTYEGLWCTMMELLEPPDILIYLRASVPFLRTRIRNRAREIEDAISEEYLSNLNESYDNMFYNGTYIDNSCKNHIVVHAADIEGEFGEVDRESPTYKLLLSKCGELILTNWT